MIQWYYFCYQSLLVLHAQYYKHLKWAKGHLPLDISPDIFRPCQILNYYDMSWCQPRGVTSWGICQGHWEIPGGHIQVRHLSGYVLESLK